MPLSKMSLFALQATLGHTVTGTPGWWAPEMEKHLREGALVHEATKQLPDINPLRADMFSFGMVLLALMTGIQTPMAWATGRSNND